MQLHGGISLPVRYRFFGTMSRRLAVGQRLSIAFCAARKSTHRPVNRPRPRRVSPSSSWIDRSTRSWLRTGSGKMSRCTRSRQIHALVPVQTRRGDWEILRTDGSGSRLVLLLLLRPLAPSITRYSTKQRETRV